MWEQAQKEKEGVRMELARKEKPLTGLLPGFLSGLVCAGANMKHEKEREDGLLTAEELTWLDLSEVDLVVLSACETGIGEPKSGEGMIGLRRSLRRRLRTLVPPEGERGKHLLPCGQQEQEEHET